MTPYIDTKTIGGSDVGALLGLNSYATPQDIYERLIDPKPRHGNDRESNPDLRRGIIMEPIIADEYEFITGRSVATVDRKFHPLYPNIAHVSIDRVIQECDDHTGPGVLEIKCHNAWKFKQAKEEGVNPSYYAQVQHALWITGWTWGSFALFNPDRWDLWHFDVARDEPMIAQIEKAVLGFWNENVVPRVPPNGQTTYAIDESKLGIDKTVVKRNDSPWLAAVDRYKHAVEALMIAETAEASCKAEIQQMMGEAQAVTGGGVTVKWSQGSSSSFDVKKLALDYPEIPLESYTKKTTFPKFLKTWEKVR